MEEAQEEQAQEEGQEEAETMEEDGDKAQAEAEGSCEATDNGKIDLEDRLQKLGYKCQETEEYDCCRIILIFRMLLFIDSLHDFTDNSRLEYNNVEIQENDVITYTVSTAEGCTKSLQLNFLMLTNNIAIPLDCYLGRGGLGTNKQAAFEFFITNYPPKEGSVEVKNIETIRRFIVKSCASSCTVTTPGVIPCKSRDNTISLLKKNAALRECLRKLFESHEIKPLTLKIDITDDIKNDFKNASTEAVGSMEFINERKAIYYILYLQLICDIITILSNTNCEADRAETAPNLLKKKLETHQQTAVNGLDNLDNLCSEDERENCKWGKSNCYIKDYISLIKYIIDELNSYIKSDQMPVKKLKTNFKYLLRALNIVRYIPKNDLLHATSGRTTEETENFKVMYLRGSITNRAKGIVPGEARATCCFDPQVEWRKNLDNLVARTTSLLALPGPSKKKWPIKLFIDAASKGRSGKIIANYLWNIMNNPINGKLNKDLVWTDLIKFENTLANQYDSAGKSNISNIVNRCFELPTECIGTPEEEEDTEDREFKITCGGSNEFLQINFKKIKHKSQVKINKWFFQDVSSNNISTKSSLSHCYTEFVNKVIEFVNKGIGLPAQNKPYDLYELCKGLVASTCPQEILSLFLELFYKSVGDLGQILYFAQCWSCGNMCVFHTIDSWCAGIASLFGNYVIAEFSNDKLQVDDFVDVINYDTCKKKKADSMQDDEGISAGESLEEYWTKIINSARNKLSRAEAIKTSQPQRRVENLRRDFCRTYFLPCMDLYSYYNNMYHVSCYEYEILSRLSFKTIGRKKVGDGTSIVKYLADQALLANTEEAKGKQEVISGAQDFLDMMSNFRGSPTSVSTSAAGASSVLTEVGQQARLSAQKASLDRRAKDRANRGGKPKTKKKHRKQKSKRRKTPYKNRRKSNKRRRRRRGSRIRIKKKTIKHR